MSDCLVVCFGSQPRQGPEVEIPNSFCLSKFSQVCSDFTFSSNRKSRHTYLSRFSQVCPDFHFLQIANLDTHTCPNFLKCVICDRKVVQIFSSVFKIRFSSKTQIYTHLRKSRQLCVEICDLKKMQILNTLEKI